MTRRKKTYFPRVAGDPSPVEITVESRVRFSDTDAMAIVWHGRYPRFFEMAAEALAGHIGLTYKAYYENNLRAPIVQMHVDYHRPLPLEAKIRIKAALIWSKAARLNTEYTIYQENGIIAATGYTVQMFTDAASGEPYILPPPLLETILGKWQSGGFGKL
ncbi:conserved hypothetical protein [Desulfamplus magnetovallimortis]|uniref:Thioesterase superfamily protein n=1 Tax=Desulfamplus magnetovallimortis TaxID=1246637 RepID=L0R722_9BACT|nr:acyl-CoA thioesterase [Desulfamplus magnetovallimortis]CCO06766.1 conserved hypothetical protein [Desulfamplus magnetovallimortis BW-1]SLM32817.1 conserved hypothetical protein [Desulfamplus magnetovallimortis]